MTVLWSAFRTRLRRSLKEPTPSKWSDDELLYFVNSALDALAEHTAKESVKAYTAEANLTAVALPDDLHTLGAVWFPKRVLVPCVPLLPGQMFPSETVTTTSLPLGYYRWPAGTLRLTQALPAGQTMEIFYWAYWPAIVDDGSVLEAPRWSLDAIEWYALYKAMTKHAVAGALLGQWDTKQESGRPQDNPMKEYADFAHEQYRRALAEHGAQDRTGWEQPVT